MVQLRKYRPLAPSAAGPIQALLDPAVFRALADPRRTRLLSVLAGCGRACSVSEIAACCPVDLSGVSRHLAELRRAGLVEAEREGRTVSYRVPATRISELLRRIASAFDACAAGGCCGARSAATVPTPKKGRRP